MTKNREQAEASTRNQEVSNRAPSQIQDKAAIQDSDSSNGLEFVDATQQVNNETEASENKESESEDAGS